MRDVLLDAPVIVVQEVVTRLGRRPRGAATLLDGTGRKIGAVRQVKRPLRQRWTAWIRERTYEVLDGDGNVLLAVTRPPNYFMASITVADGSGAPVGEILQRNVGSRIRFGLEVDGMEVGEVANGWGPWDVSIRDADGGEVARIFKKPAAEFLRPLKTPASYVVEISGPLDEPLRTMVIAAGALFGAALAVDSEGIWARRLFSFSV